MHDSFPESELLYIRRAAEFRVVALGGGNCQAAGRPGWGWFRRGGLCCGRAARPGGRAQARAPAPHREMGSFRGRDLVQLLWVEAANWVRLVSLVFRSPGAGRGGVSISGGRVAV